MRISIFGLGYVGCVSLACLAKEGHDVIGVDISDVKVQLVKEGKSPIIEKGIDQVIKEQYQSGRITATRDASYAVLNSDVSFICVGTPATPNGHLNLDAIYKVSSEIAPAIGKRQGFHVVVIRSTVSPGTNNALSTYIERESGKVLDRDFAVVSNPEFLREGSAVKDFYDPPYTLVGSNNEKAVDLLRNVYKSIPSPFIVTNIKVAEMIKYVNNTFHALKITFSNEIGRICKSLGVDSHELMDVFCKDTKLNISPTYLKPGFAYGGSCLPKDLKAFRSIAHDSYLECPVIESIEGSNQLQKQIVFNEILRLDKRKVGFLGLSFKTGTDDLRGSPIVDVIERLLGKGFDIMVYDRHVHLSRLMGGNKEYILKKIPFISHFLTDNLSQVVDHSEILVFVNYEPEFSDLVDNLRDGTIVYDLIRLPKKSQRIYQYHGIAW